MIRVLVADDQALVRGGFTVLLEHDPGIDVVGEASTGREAVDLTVRHHPDVVLMDIRMPDMDGIEATRRITDDPACASTRVLVLTTFDLDEYVFEALRAGASGFLLKDTQPTDLLNAIVVVAEGEALLSPRITSKLVADFASREERSRAVDETALAVLTDREREVLVLAGRGHSNAEIAEELYVSMATAKTHVSRVLTKLHARDRAQLVVIAYETGLITPGTS
jgi:DNA-binding NarL/FixJ family response regulator